MRKYLTAADIDVICLTESYSDFLPAGGHQIEAIEDYGYTIIPGRRKVLLWSKWPWLSSDPVGSPALPPGRFVSGMLDTPLGAIGIIGVCIPWKSAHVSSGRRDRKLWDDHLTYLKALPSALGSHRPSVVLGDFNQMVPKSKQPDLVHAALLDAFAGYSIATSGVKSSGGEKAIDHVAHTSELSCSVVAELPGSGPDGRHLSDHFGLVVELRRVQAPIRPSACIS